MGWTRRPWGRFGSQRRPTWYSCVLGAALTLLLVLPATAAADWSDAYDGPLTWSYPVRVDAMAPFTSAEVTRRVSCPSTNLCVGVGPVGGDVVTTSTPASTSTGWTPTSIPAATGSLDDVACPTTTLCVATGTAYTPDGTFGALWASTDPTGGSGTWALEVTTDEPGELEEVSCPTATLCVTGDGSGDILTSTDPSGGPGAWQDTHLSSGDTGSISCPTASFCIGGDGRGGILTSSDPTGGADAWTSSESDDAVADVSCVSASLCVASSGSYDGVVVSTDPSGDPSTWTAVRISGVQSIQAVRCRPDGLCVALDSFGSIAATTDPTGGSAAWHPVSVTDPYPLSDVACPSDSLCVAVSPQDIAVSTDPTAGAWTPVVLDGNNAVTGVSCPTTSLCVGVDDAGNALWSTDPTEQTGPWAGARIDTHPLLAVACPDSGLCVAVDQAGNVLTSTDPAGGAGTWTSAAVDPGNPIQFVSCTAAPTCVALDGAGNGLTSADPGGGTGAWNVGSVVTPSNGNRFTGLSCGSVKLCVATTGDGDAIIATNPTSGGFWRTDVVAGYYGLSGVSCSSATFCVMGSGSYALVSTNPTAGPSSWVNVGVASLNGIDGVVCSSPSLCINYSGLGGEVSQSSDPAGHPNVDSQWDNGIPQVTQAPWLESATCASDQFCLVSDKSSNVWIGTAPGFQGGTGGTDGTGSGPDAGSGSGAGVTGATGTGGSGGSGIAPAAPPSSSTSPSRATSAPAPAAGGVKTSVVSPTAAVSPRLRVRITGLTADRRHAVRVTLGCTGPAGERCRGAITLLLHIRTRTRGAHGAQTGLRSLVLESVHYTLAAGHTAATTLKLGSPQIRRLQSAGRGATLQATVAIAGAPAASRALLVSAAVREFGM
jgi:hypothetical protein